MQKPISKKYIEKVIRKTVVSEQHFALQGPKRSLNVSQSDKRSQNASQSDQNGEQNEPKGTKRESKGCQKLTKMHNNIDS